MGISVILSQGHPSPPVEAAICSDGGQMQPVTSPALAVTHFYFWMSPPPHSLRLGKWSMSALKLVTHELISFPSVQPSRAWYRY